MKWEVRRVHRGSLQRTTSVPAHSLVPYEKLILVGTTVGCGGESLTAGAGVGSCEFTARKQKMGQKLDRTIALQVTHWPTSSCVALQLPQAVPPSGGCSGSGVCGDCFTCTPCLLMSLQPVTDTVLALHMIIHLLNFCWFLCACCCLESIKTYPIEWCEFWMVVTIVTAQNCVFFFSGNFAFLVLEIKVFYLKKN